MRAVALALVLSVAAQAQEQVWRWVDEQGEEHYTNDKSAIPENFRAKATSTEGAELSVLSTVSPGVEPGIPAPPRPPPVAAPASKSPVNRVVLFEALTSFASKALRRSGVVEKLVADNPGLKLERVEFATAVDRAEQLKVTEVPTVLFLDGTGAERGRVAGLGTLQQLQKELDRARGLTRAEPRGTTR